MLGFGSVTNLLTTRGGGLSSRNTPGQTLRYGQYGNKYDKVGRALLSRNTRMADVVYGMSGLRFGLMPEHKFLFYVRFVRPPSATLGQPPVQGAIDWSRGLGFVLKKINQPSVTFKVATLNQYNKIRQIQTGREYGDLDMTFHDTYDKRVKLMLAEYFAYHFNDAFQLNPTTFLPDQTDREMAGAATGWGLNLHQGKNAKEQPFFSTIEIYQFGQKSYTKTIIINPILSRYDPDDLVYDEGTMTQEIQMSFSFEGMIIGTERYKSDDMLDETKLALSDFFEPETQEISAEQFGVPFQENAAPAGPDFLGNLSTSVGNAILSGNGNLSSVARNSVLDSFGYFDFAGLNAGSAVSAYQNGQLTDTVLINSGVPGAREYVAGNQVRDSSSLGGLGALAAGGALLGGLSSAPQPTPAIQTRQTLNQRNLQSNLSTGLFGGRPVTP